MNKIKKIIKICQDRSEDDKYADQIMKGVKVIIANTP